MVLVGDRVHLGDKGCGTVKWVGNLDGYSSVRAGIELDSPTDACHDGIFRENRVFECKGKSGVFVKADKINVGISLVEAIRQRYVSPDEEGNPINNEPPAVSSIPTPILVGEEKAKKYFSDNLYELSEISVDEAPVSSIGLHEEELIKFKQLRKISMRYNLFSNVDPILRVCELIPSLTEVDISGSYFTRPISVKTSAPRITKLIAIGCKTRETFPKDLESIFPNLTSLYLDATGDLLTNLASLPGSVKTLSIQGVSGITDWSDLASHITRLMISLETLDISRNAWIGDLTINEDIKSALSQIQSLDVSECSISDWATLSSLSTVMSNSLLSLRVSLNPFYECNPSKGRQILITLFPKLVLLNNATVSQRLRDQSELYCANLLSKGDQLVCTCIPENLKKNLLEKFFIAPDAVNENFTSSGKTERGSSMLTLSVVGMGNPVCIRVPKVSRISDLVRIVASKISWPLKESQLRLHASYSAADTLSSIPLDELDCDLLDMGIENGWTIFTSLNDPTG